MIQFKKHYNENKHLKEDDIKKLIKKINDLKCVSKDIYVCGTSIFRTLDKEEKEKFLEGFKKEISCWKSKNGIYVSIQNIVDVNQNIFEFDKNIVKDILESYLNDMNQYILNNTEKSRIEAIYKSIPSQLGNVSNKFQYSKINSNARSRDYETALQWLVSSNMIYKCNLLKTIQISPKAYINEEYFKLYISDVGILTSLLEIQYNDILLDNNFLYKGNIAENYLAEQLVRNGVSLYYWKSNSDAEIDFILYNEDGLIPIEVKASDNITSKSLNSYVKKYNPKYSIRVSSKNFGFENNIKSVPLYAAFLIK